MNFLAASAFRQNTFIIVKSTRFDSASESSLHHDSFVVPVIEQHLAGSRETVLVPRNTCSSSTTHENLNRTSNKQVDKPDKTQHQRTTPHKTRLCQDSGFNVPFLLSSSLRKKLGQEQQATIISTELNSKESITGRVSDHSAHKHSAHKHSAHKHSAHKHSAHKHSAHKQTANPTTPEYALATIRSETARVGDSKLKQNLLPKFNSETARVGDSTLKQNLLPKFNSETARVGDSTLKQNLLPKFNSETHSDSSLNVKRKHQSLPGVAGPAHNSFSTTSNKVPTKSPLVADTDPAHNSFSTTSNKVPTKSPLVVDTGPPKQGPALTQHTSLTAYRQSSRHQQSTQLSRSTEACSSVSQKHCQSAAIVSTNSCVSPSADSNPFFTTVTEVSDNGINDKVRATESTSLSQSSESKSNRLARGSLVDNFGEVKSNYKPKSLENPININHTNFNHTIINHTNINHHRLHSRTRPFHTGDATILDKLKFGQSNLKEKAQRGENTKVRDLGFDPKHSWLPGSESIDAARSPPVHSVEISPLTPQTIRHLGLLVGEHEPGVLLKADPTRQDQAPNKEAFSKPLWNIADNIGPQSSLKATPTMAKSDRFDDGHERFEDVLKERNDMLKSERVYTKRIRQLEEELKAMVNQCQQLSNENKELRTLDGVKKTGQNSNKADALAKLTALESERAKLAAAHDATLKQMDSLVSENTKVKRENAQLETKARELDKQLVSLQYDNAQISDLQAAISRMQLANETLEATGKSLERDRAALDKSLDSKRQECEQLTRAVQTATVNESHLRDAQEKLERTQEESNHIKQELTDLKTRLAETETRRQALQEQVSDRDKTIEMLNLDIDKKEKLLRDLQDDLDTCKKETLTLKDEHRASTEEERETADLKSKMGFLKAELDHSLTENKRLKQGREEMELTIEELRQKISAESGSEKYFRIWEQEKEHHIAVETDLAKKREEVKGLETRLKDADNRLAELGRKIKFLEDKREHVGMSALDGSDAQVLKDGNMKLRQMLVERNIQLTNTKHEQTLADSLIRTLELKQKKAEIRLQLLSKRVGNASQSPGQDSRSTEAVKLLTTSSNKNSLPSGPAKNSQSVKLPPHKEHRDRNLQPVRSFQTSQPVSPSRRSNLQGSPLDGTSKMGEEKLHETSSSLSQLETRPANSPQSSSGYFALYRVKQKRSQEKGY